MKLEFLRSLAAQLARIARRDLSNEDKKTARDASTSSKRWFRRGLSLRQGL